MRDGTKNLKPYGSLTEEEQKALVKKAGKASGKARKEKKELQQQMLIAMEAFTKERKESPYVSPEIKQILKKKVNILVAELYVTAFKNKRDSNGNIIQIKPETRLKAMEMIMDRMYGKPKETIDLTEITHKAELTEEEEQRRIEELSK